MAEESNLPVVTAIGDLETTSSRGDLQISNVLTGGFSRLSNGIFGLRDSFEYISDRQIEMQQQQMFEQQKFFRDSVEAQYSSSNTGLQKLQTLFQFLTQSASRQIAKLEEEKNELTTQVMTQQQQLMKNVSDNIKNSAQITAIMRAQSGIFAKLQDTLGALIARFDKMLILSGEQTRMSAKARMDTLKRRGAEKYGEDFETVWKNHLKEVENILAYGQKPEENQFVLARRLKYGPELEGLESLQRVQKQTERMVNEIKDSEGVIAKTNQARLEEVQTINASKRAKQEEIREEKKVRVERARTAEAERRRKSDPFGMAYENKLTQSISKFLLWMKKREEQKKYDKQLKEEFQAERKQETGMGSTMLLATRALGSAVFWKAIAATAIAGFATYGAYKIYEGFTKELTEEEKKQREINRKEYLENRGLEADNWKRNLLGPLEGLFKTNNKELAEIQAYHRDEWQENQSDWFVSLKEWWEGSSINPANWFKNDNQLPPNVRAEPMTGGSESDMNNLANTGQYAPGFEPVAPRTPGDVGVKQRTDGSRVNAASSEMANAGNGGGSTNIVGNGDTYNVDASTKSNQTIQIPKSPNGPSMTNDPAFGWMGP